MCSGESDLGLREGAKRAVVFCLLRAFSFPFFFSRVMGGGYLREQVDGV